MRWWYYLIGYYILCIVVGVCVVIDDIKNNDNKDDWETKEWIRLFLLSPFILPIGALIYSASEIIEYPKKLWKKSKKKHEFVEKYNFNPDEHYICFSMMGGAGVIECEECGHKEKIVSFLHYWRCSDSGRQCPKCYAFSSEHNVSDNDHSYGKPESDFLCPHCGTIIRKKDESMTKDDDKPLFCPKCHSHKLHYHCEYIT